MCFSPLNWCSILFVWGPPSVILGCDSLWRFVQQFIQGLSRPGEIWYITTITTKDSNQLSHFTNCRCFLFLQYWWQHNLVPDHWKRKRERVTKIYWSVTARWTLQSTKLKDYRTPTRCGLLFTVVAVNWICVRPKGGQKKKNVVFIASYIINQCTWCAYKTPTVLDNCLQLCICRFIFLIFGLSTVPFFMRVSERYFMSCY